MKKIVTLDRERERTSHPLGPEARRAVEAKLSVENTFVAVLPDDLAGNLCQPHWRYSYFSSKESLILKFLVKSV